MVGVTFQQLQKYETAVNRVSGSRLWLLARALNVTIADFFPPHDHENALCDLDIASKKDLKLIRELVRIDAPEKEAIRNIVSTMVRTTNSRPHAP